MPEHDAVADREVDLAGDHRDHRGERQQRDDRLVGHDRAQVEHRRERVCGSRSENRSDEQPRSGSAGRRPAAAGAIRWPSDAPRSSARVGSSAFDLIEFIAMRLPPASACLSGGFGGRGGGDHGLGGQAVAGDLGDDPAAVEDERAVADMGDLLEVGGDDDDREASARARAAISR